VGGLRHGMQPAYKHMKDYDYVRRIRKKDENGKVIFGPPNMISNPGKKGHFGTTIGHLIAPYPEHMKEPYDRARLLKKVP